MLSSELETLPIGTKINYVFFKNLSYQGLTDKGEVLVVDTAGNTKSIYRDLFWKYAIKVEEE